MFVSVLGENPTVEKLSVDSLCDSRDFSGCPLLKAETNEIVTFIKEDSVIDSVTLVFLVLFVTRRKALTG